MTPSARSLVEGVRDAIGHQLFPENQELLPASTFVAAYLHQAREWTEALTTALSLMEAETSQLRAAAHTLIDAAVELGPSVKEECAIETLTSMLDTREGKEPLP